MARRIRKESGSIHLKNDFQDELVVKKDQIGNLVVILEKVKELGFRIPESKDYPTERDVYLESGDLQIVQPGNDRQEFTLLNTRNGSYMWFRNDQMATGVVNAFNDEFVIETWNVEAQAVR